MFGEWKDLLLTNMPGEMFFSITAKLCRDSAGVVFYLGEKDGVIFTIDNNDIRYRDSNIEHS